MIQSIERRRSPRATTLAHRVARASEVAETVMALLGAVAFIVAVSVATFVVLGAVM